MESTAAAAAAVAASRPSLDWIKRNFYLHPLARALGLKTSRKAEESFVPLGILALSRRFLATTGGSTFFTSEMEKVATRARGWLRPSRPGGERAEVGEGER